jgi:hypothetical protein
LDIDETFTLIARLEPIRILLAYATSHNIKLHQMNLFMLSYRGFEDYKGSNHVYKLSKASHALDVDKGIFFTQIM